MSAPIRRRHDLLCRPIQAAVRLALLLALIAGGLSVAGEAARAQDTQIQGLLQRILGVGGLHGLNTFVFKVAGHRRRRQRPGMPGTGCEHHRILLG